MSTALQRKLNRVLAVLGAALIVATGVVLVSCGGQDDDDAAEQAGPAGAVDRVEIKDFLYEPAMITVPVGTTITWTNSDTAPHTSTSGTSPQPDGVFDSETMKKGERKTVKVTKPGTFAYFCEFHPFMKATVIVE